MGQGGSALPASSSQCFSCVCYVVLAIVLSAVICCLSYCSLFLLSVVLHRSLSLFRYFFLFCILACFWLSCCIACPEILARNHALEWGGGILTCWNPAHQQAPKKCQWSMSVPLGGLRETINFESRTLQHLTTLHPNL